MTACTALRVASHHDREGGVARAHIATGYRGVNRRETLGRRTFGDLAAERWVRRRHVDEHRARLCAGQDSGLAEIDLPDVLGKAHHREEDIGFSRHSARTLGPLCAAIEQWLRLRTCAAMDGHVIAGREKMATHRRSHHAGADPADSCGRRMASRNGHRLRAHLFGERVDSIRHRLNDAFPISRHLYPLKTQIVAPVTRRLDRGSEFNPLPVFDIGIFHGWDSATSVDGDVDRGCLVFQVEQIGTVARRAGRELVGIEWRHIANSALQCNLFQMKRLRVIEDLANGDGLRG